MDKKIIYQLFLRVYANKNTTNAFNGTLAENGTGKFNDMSTKALKTIKDLGVTHIWFTGVIEHATLESFPEISCTGENPQVVKGIAGSPYAIKDYYDVNPYLAENQASRMQEFEAMLERTHNLGMNAIIDFVPNHVARQYHSDAKPKGVMDLGATDFTETNFSPQNNFYYLPYQNFVVPPNVDPPLSFEKSYQEFPAKATGNDVFTATPNINDWYETVKLNYGVNYYNNQETFFAPIPDTWKKMLDILLFWVKKGVDGFRCDMAEMVPVAFWAWAIPQVKAVNNNVIFIAEIYNPTLYRAYLDIGKFDYLYDKVGLYDTLRRLIEGHGNAMDITAVWQRESGDFSEKMLRFLENHDEQRIASPQFGGTPESAFAAMMLAGSLHTGPLMIYGGQEFGVKPDKAAGFQSLDGRTTIFDFWGLPELSNWLEQYKEDALEVGKQKVRSFYKKMLNFILAKPAVCNGLFHDLQYLNSHGQSNGYDETKLYSYLRYTDGQCLLFAFNFDQQNAITTLIKMPDYILKNNKKNGEFQEVFTLNQTLHFMADEKPEIHLTLNPNSFRIFEYKAV